MQVGDRVRVKPPFDTALPGEYVIESQNPDTGAWRIADGVDFSEEHLEPVT